MSKYQSSETNMSDPACLVQALVQMGFDPAHIEQHETAQTLYDWHGQARPEKAHVIIRRAHTGLCASNDVGFVKDAETGKFTGIISQYDEQKFDTGWMGRLKQGYTTIRTIATAKAKGYRCLGIETVEGKVKLRFAAR